MSKATIKLSILTGRYSIFRLPPDAPIPSWMDWSNFWTITKTQDELSIVCRQNSIAGDLKAETGWTVMKVQGPLSFELTGVLASIARSLAEADVSIFAVSTFDTDYILVKENKFEAAKQSLIKAGFEL